MEGFVCIEKLEKLESFNFGSTKLKELVLSDVNPFPGYYSETPGGQDSKFKFVFVAIKQGKGCYEDEVLRAGIAVKNKLNINFEANYGRFLLFNKMRPCIRFNVEDYSNVAEIIEGFKGEGIEFDANQKVQAYESNIKIRKYLTFNQISGDIFAGEENFYYIKVSKHLKWDDFVELIFSIRRSGDFGVFDAAQTSLYLKDEIVEFVRIYTKSFSEDDLKVLNEQICKRM